jgi:HPt (histidine-containing phosphotransfer) domain-containing protein
MTNDAPGVAIGADLAEVFDPAPLLESIDGDREAFAELANLFLSTSIEQVGALASALDAGDFALARDAVHGFKGSVALFATPAAVARLARLEHACRTAAPFDHAAGIAEVRGVVTALHRALADFASIG